MTVTALICILGATAAGVALRHALSNGHPSSETEEIVSAAGSLIISLTAFTIGFLIAGAKSSFDFSANELKALAAKMILLNGILVEYGPPADVAREQLRQALIKTINLISLPPTSGSEALGDLRMSALLDTILCLTPENEKQSWLRTSALSFCNDITSSLSMAYVNLGYRDRAATLDRTYILALKYFLGIWISRPLKSDRAGRAACGRSRYDLGDKFDSPNSTRCHFKYSLASASNHFRWRSIRLQQPDWILDEKRMRLKRAGLSAMASRCTILFRASVAR